MYRYYGIYGFDFGFRKNRLWGRLERKLKDVCCLEHGKDSGVLWVDVL